MKNKHTNSLSKFVNFQQKTTCFTILQKEKAEDLTSALNFIKLYQVD